MRRYGKWYVYDFHKGICVTEKQSFGDVLQNRCFHRKRLVLVSWTTLLKRDSNTVFSCVICKISKNTFFCRIPLVAASGDYQNSVMMSMSYLVFEFDIVRILRNCSSCVTVSLAGLKRNSQFV